MLQTCECSSRSSRLMPSASFASCCETAWLWMMRVAWVLASNSAFVNWLNTSAHNTLCKQDNYIKCGSNWLITEYRMTHLRHIIRISAYVTNGTHGLTVNESSREQKGQEAKGPRSESSRERIGQGSIGPEGPAHFFNLLNWCYSSPCCYFNCVLTVLFDTVLPSRSGSRTLGTKYISIRLD